MRTKKVGVRILIKSLWKESKIPHVDPEVGFAKDGPFWTMKAQMEQWAKGVRVYTYPVVKLFGANINTYAITDYDMARELMVKSNALGGHEELAAWFHLVAEWRQRTGGKMADELNGYEIGVLRCYDHKNPTGTKISKLLRKRVTEFMNKKSLEPMWISAIKDQDHMMVKRFKEVGNNGKTPIDALDLFEEPAMSVLMRFLTGDDHQEDLTMLIKLGDCAKDMISTFIRVDQWKIILGLLPPWIRKFIPLSLWPEWVGQQLELVDICIDMIEKYRENWREGEEDGTFLKILETDRVAGRITNNDVVWTVHSLIGLVFF